MPVSNMVYENKQKLIHTYNKDITVHVIEQNFMSVM